MFSRNTCFLIPHNGLCSIMEKYDEDVYENPFFTALQNDYSQLYDEVISLRCTVRHNFLSLLFLYIKRLDFVSVLHRKCNHFFYRHMPVE